MSTPASKGMVLVTGSSTGIGFACRELLAEAGYFVIAGQRSIPLALQEQSGGRVVTAELDVTQAEHIDRIRDLAAELNEKTPLIGLINNAGVGLNGPFETVSAGEAKKVLEVNLLGVVAMTTALFPLLKKNDGRIINIGSTSGRIPRPGSAVYGASKAALDSLTSALRMEAQASGVKVSIIVPGVVSTPFWEKLGDGDNAEVSGMHPKQVARAVLAALQAGEPRRRYIVGKDARFALLLHKLLPLYLSEYLRTQRYKA
ncbi:MAG: SDR family NAD(P)-dependent oxidoreductase [Pseudomonadota bacterium]